MCVCLCVYVCVKHYDGIIEEEKHISKKLLFFIKETFLGQEMGLVHCNLQFFSIGNAVTTYLVEKFSKTSNK